MDRFERNFKQVITSGNWVGGFVFLVIMMIVILAVAGRLFRISFAGANELVETFIVISVSFAIPYTSLMKGQVAIEIITERFKPRMKAWADVIAQFLTLLIWVLIFVAAIIITGENGLKEFSHFIKIPYLPFRIIWIFGLSLVCLVFLVDFIKALKLVVKNKWIQ